MRKSKILSLALAIALVLSCVPFAMAESADSAAAPSVWRFDFGSDTSPAADGYTKITPSSNYDSAVGYGWINDSRITITATDDATGDPLRGDYISGNNARVTSGSSGDYYFPSFNVDVPAGVYSVRLIRGSAVSEVCSGAVIEEDYSAIKWYTDALPNTFTAEPSALITAPAGTYLDDTVTVAVWDGKLTIDIATSMTAAGVSGVAVVNAIEITKLPDGNEPGVKPTLFAVGDSTTATYPPFTQPDLAPIPEQTGWGAVLDRFFTDGVVVENWALGGMSAKNYLTEGFWNDVILRVKQGDVVLIEWGINESATGRRYIASDTSFDPWLRRYTNAVLSRGATPIIVSGTSAGGGYRTRMAAVSAADGVSYIDLQALFSAYKTARTTTQRDYLTIDGTHPSRVGAIVMAQLVTNAMKSIESLPLNAFNTAAAVTAANVAPTYVPQNVRVERQTTTSVTIAWDCPESVMYDPTQLITRFPIYRRAAGSTDAPTGYGEGTAYVLAGMSGPRCAFTVAHDGGDYEYFVASRGVNGTGAMSSPALPVGTYLEDDYSACARMIGYCDRLDRYDYTYESYEHMLREVAFARSALGGGNAASWAEARGRLNAAIAGLVRIMTANFFDDFDGAFDGSIATPWGTTTDPTGGTLTRILEDDGNYILNNYVSASRESSRKKAFPALPANSLASVQFEWFSSRPDSRNVCELRFYSTDTNASSLFFGLKVSSNGHIGYFASNTAPNVRGDGFHEASNAVDLGLPTGIWYNVNIEFNFAAKTARLQLAPRDAADKGTVAPVVVSDIALPSTATTLYSMRFHAARGQNDTGTNDLSVLWNTSFDNFGIYCLPTGYSVNLSALETALAAAAAVNPADITAESFATLTAAVETANFILTYRNKAQSDIDYAAALVNAALAGLVEITASVTTPTIVSGLSAWLNITTKEQSGTAAINVGGQLLYPTAIAAGAARMYIAGAPAPGVYEIYVNGVPSGRYVEVVALSADIWSPSIVRNGDGKAAIVFGDTISTKVGYSATLGGAAIAVSQLGTNTLLTDVDYDTLAAGAKLVVKGVKYPNLFPSYSFTFTITK